MGYQVSTLQVVGKVGNVVGSRGQNGKILMRNKAASIKNPKTDLQMAHRVSLSGASKAASQLKDIIDHSFEGVAYGSKSVRYFEGEAIKTLKNLNGTVYAGVKVTPNTSLTALGMPCAPFLISRGSLPTINPIASSDYTSQVSSLAFMLPTGATKATLTVAQFCAAMGITINDQFTVVRVDNHIGEDGFNYGLADFYRYNFKEGLAGTELIFIPDADPEENKVTFNPAVFDSERTTDINGLNLECNSVSFSFYVQCAAAAIIASRFTNGVWQRSTQRLLQLFPRNDIEFDSETMNEGGWNKWDDLLSTLRYAEATAAETRYLNKEPNSEL